MSMSRALEERVCLLGRYLRRAFGNATERTDRADARDEGDDVCVRTWAPAEGDTFNRVRGAKRQE